MLGKFVKNVFRSGPYTYAETRIDRGYGKENAALGRPHYPLASGQYGPRYNVQNSMAPLPNKGSLIVAQSLPKTDLKANAVYFGGSFALTPLNAPGNF